MIKQNLTKKEIQQAIKKSIKIAKNEIKEWTRFLKELLIELQKLK